jgi:ATP-binding cassette subfamily B protein
MSLKTNSVISVPELEFKSLLTPHRLRGMWRMMRGFRIKYLGANLSLGLAALFKTSTFLLVRYFADNVLGRPEKNALLPLFGLGFVLLAALEGICTFTGGRLAANTAEGITFRLRNYLFDHLQRLSFSRFADFECQDRPGVNHRHASCPGNLHLFFP